MLTYAADFWPLFWTIIGGGALLSVLASLLVATVSPSWFGRRGTPQPAVASGSGASGHEAPAELPKAA